MRARDLAESAAVLRPQDSAADALARFAFSAQPGILVDVGHGGYIAVPGSQLLRLLLPAYVLDDPSLGRVWDEAHADRLAQDLPGRTVQDLLTQMQDERDDDRPPAVVDGDATLVEVAAVMATAHAPLVAVVDDGRLLGAVTVNRLVSRLLA
ncbi:MAG: CBS domain-containing protein [Candidatus Nanopelagicales bacterium]